MNIRNAVAAICISASWAGAQGGSGAGGCDVGRGFECSMVHGHDGDGREQHDWVRAIVLWRLDASDRGGMRDTAGGRVREERYKQARRAAEDSGRVVIGAAGSAQFSSASMTWGVGRRTRDTLFVMERQFEIPRRDSALVVMIGMPAGDASGPPRLIGTAWVPAELDRAYWQKHWRSGDTLFTVMPRRDNTILADALMRSPQVRSFLLRAP